MANEFLSYQILVDPPADCPACFFAVRGVGSVPDGREFAAVWFLPAEAVNDPDYPTEANIRRQIENYPLDEIGSEIEEK